MNKSYKRIVAVLAAVLVTSILAACHHGHRDHGNTKGFAIFMEKSVAHVLSSINVTDEQREQIDRLTGELVEDAKQVRSGHEADRDNIVACLLLDKPNSDWLHGKVDEKAKAWTEFSHRSVDRLIEISAVLSPEQRQELKERFASAHGAGE